MITYSTKMDEVFNVIFIQNPAAGWHWTAYIDPLTYFSWAILFTWVVAAAPILFIAARFLILMLIQDADFKAKIVFFSPDMVQWTKTLMNSPSQKYL